MAWSSKDVLFISVATGFVFCFATIYVQQAMKKYVEKQVYEKTRQNPLVGMGLVSEKSRPQQERPVNHKIVPEVHASPPPGSGKRWTPLLI